MLFQQTLVGRKVNGWLLGGFQESFFSFFEVDDIPDSRKVLKMTRNQNIMTQESGVKGNKEWVEATKDIHLVLRSCTIYEKVRAAPVTVSNDVNLPAGKKPTNKEQFWADDVNKPKSETYMLPDINTDDRDMGWNEAK